MMTGMLTTQFTFKVLLICECARGSSPFRLLLSRRRRRLRRCHVLLLAFFVFVILEYVTPYPAQLYPTLDIYGAWLFGCIFQSYCVL